MRQVLTVRPSRSLTFHLRHVSMPPTDGRRCAQLVAHCHLAGVMHRDIKAENFVYRTRRFEDLVVIDFGSSVFFKPGQARTATLAMRRASS
jgi:serine/threonine protein kinase